MTHCAPGGIFRQTDCGPGLSGNVERFHDWHADDQVCTAYLEHLKWLGGFYCPACGLSDTPGRAIRGPLLTAIGCLEVMLGSAAGNCFGR